MKEGGFYRDKQVLVTGGASFIGSHLVDALVQSGALVRVVDDFSSGLRENLHRSIEKIDLIEGDLREFNVCAQVTKSIDIVFHLANIHGGRGFIETHQAEITQNLVIDGNMLRAGLENRIDRFCYASSACVYPVSLQVSDANLQERFLSEEMADPFVENRALADGEYGWCKLMGEMSLSAYGRQFGMNGVSCRLFTVYGPRENESHAIIAFIAKALIEQEPFEVWGTGKQDRNFTYVQDVIDGLLRSAQNITDCRAVNIGTDEIIQVGDAAKTVCKVVGYKPNKFFFNKSKPEGVHSRAASIENQKKWLKWHPQTAFIDGVRNTIEWYSRKIDIQDLKANLDYKLFER